MSEALTLPPVADVDAADHKLASFCSDLDAFVMKVEKLAGGTISLADAALAKTAGVELEEQEVDVDRAACARMLVFAEETVGDAKEMQKLAERLRRALVSVYRFEVLEDEVPDDA